MSMYISVCVCVCIIPNWHAHTPRAREENAHSHIYRFVDLRLREGLYYTYYVRIINFHASNIQECVLAWCEREISQPLVHMRISLTCCDDRSLYVCVRSDVQSYPLWGNTSDTYVNRLLARWNVKSIISCLYFVIYNFFFFSYTSNMNLLLILREDKKIKKKNDR